MYELGRKSVEHLVWGATLLGCGGGGSPEWGLEILRGDLRAGLRLRVADLAELPADAIVVSAYFCGAVKPPADGSEPTDYMREAIKTLESELGCRVAAIVPTELGGGNTAAALHIAALLKLPLVDGDLAGRAVPELVHNVYLVHGKDIYPAVLVDSEGNVLVLKKYSSPQAYERLARALAEASGSIFVVDSPARVAEARHMVIRDTVSRCIELGEKLDELKKKDLKAVGEEIAAALGGGVLACGPLERINLRVEGGFLVGEYTIADRRSGRELRIFVKNENIMAWLGDEPAVMPPDLIMILGDEGPLTNSMLKRGLEVCVLYAPAPAPWRTPRGLELLGPRHFGLDYDYTPVEELAPRLLAARR